MYVCLHVYMCVCVRGEGVQVMKWCGNVLLHWTLPRTQTRLLHICHPRVSYIVNSLSVFPKCSVQILGSPVLELVSELAIICTPTNQKVNSCMEVKISET